MRQSNFQVLAAVANSGTVTSAAVTAVQIIAATCQATFTDGSAAGTLKLQGSNDAAAPATWNDIPNTSVSVTSGATSCTPVAAPPLCYNWIRAVFVSSGGAGTITARMQTVGV